MKFRLSHIDTVQLLSDCLDKKNRENEADFVSGADGLTMRRLFCKIFCCMALNSMIFASSSYLF